MDAKQTAKKDFEDRRMSAMEEVLGIVLKNGSAGDVCEALLSSFGSLENIIHAPESMIREIPGVGDSTAHFISLLSQLAQLRSEEKAWRNDKVYCTEDAVTLMRPKFFNAASECVCLLLTNPNNQVVYNGIICNGSISLVALEMGKVISICSQYGASDVYMAHNHPSGLAKPSSNDIVATDRLLIALHIIGCHLADHIILAGSSYYSMAASGLLETISEKVNNAQADQTATAYKLLSKLPPE